MYLQTGGSKPTLNCRSHHKKVSDLKGRGSMSRGKLLGAFLADFERFVCTDSGGLSKPVKGREYKLIHTYILYIRVFLSSCCSCFIYWIF